jgi:hypothetical protein
MIEWPPSRPPRKGRGGHRLGAGRKPNHLKSLRKPPITAAEIIARRHPLSERLSPEELAMLHALTKRLAEPSPDTPRNQKESNRATLGPELNPDLGRYVARPRAVVNSTLPVTAFTRTLAIWGSKLTFVWGNYKATPWAP